LLWIILRHVIEHPVDEEEVPAIESLLEDSHFSEPAACSSAGEEHCAWCLGFYKDRTAHCDTAAEFAGCVAEEPVFGNGESGRKSVKTLYGNFDECRLDIPRMSTESVYQKRGIPQRDSSMRKSSTPNLTSERSLQPTKLILQILSLLAQSALRRIRPDRFDRIANTHDFVFQPITHDREIPRKCAVVVDEEDVGELFRCVAADVLSDDLTSDGTPDVIDAVLPADFFCVV
jgi:hypothetical protein